MMCMPKELLGSAGAIVRLPEYVEKDKSKVQRACSKVFLVA